MLVRNHYINNIWSTDVRSMPKLRTYREFKQEFKCEKYLSLALKKNERSLLAQFRTGILPLRIETGRYLGEPVNSRLCRLCDSQEVENECHFVLKCQLYNAARTTCLGTLMSNDEFVNLSDTGKITYLMQNHVRQLAKYIVKAYTLRRNTLYS